MLKCRTAITELPVHAVATLVLANALEGTRDVRQHFPRVENSPDAPILVGENGVNFDEPAVYTWRNYCD